MPSPDPSAVTRNIAQAGRLLQIKTQIAADDLVIESFAGTEAVSSLFEFRLGLLSSNEAVNFSSLLKQSCTVSLTLEDEKSRPFNGILSSVRQKESTNEDLFLYEATLVPKVWLLSLYEDCRIFQNKTVPDIVSGLLDTAGITYTMPTSWPSQRTYPTRDYCVQYRETTLNFISRLLESEGIYYYFDHTATTHTMVFTDKSPSAAACPGESEISFYVPGSADPGSFNGVLSLTRLEQLHTGKVTRRDYNFETPSASLAVTVPGSGPEESYDYPGNYGKVADGNAYAKIRLEAREAAGSVIEGDSRVRTFQPGYLFTLSSHFRTDNNQTYFLLSVSHEATDTTYRTSELEASTYSNHYSAIPKAVPYRPPELTEKPQIKGVQTALVVGKAGEEIWVDKYGRVKVQFYWDRLGTKDETSSCWMRVAQIWAGKQWGWITIPRIGQEVIVDFLEGDPDRPIITGRVYNAEMMPPYTLPDNQTQSGIKTRSSKEGSASTFNEIRFEDLKGSEVLTVHAEKDMDTFIENNDSQDVENNRTIIVKGTHTETITKDTTITIDEGNHSLTLNQGNQSVELKQGNRSVVLDMGNESVNLKMGNQTVKLDMGNQTIQLAMGNQSTKADLGAISHEAMQSITLTVGPSSIKIDPMGITLQAMQIKINGEIMTQVQSAMVDITGGMVMINS